MIPVHPLRLRALAEVIVRIGLNLQPGQRLLIAEPYEGHGVDESARHLVAAVLNAALDAGMAPDGGEVIWSQPDKLGQLVRRRDWRGVMKLVAAHAHRMNDAVQRGDALLFLLGAPPRALSQFPAADVAEFRKIGADFFSAVAQQLTHGATNWTAAPAPSDTWAELAFSERAPADRLSTLWETVLDTMHVAPVASDLNEQAYCQQTLNRWRQNLQELDRRRATLQAGRYRAVHFTGEGTDLTIDLPAGHRWCTSRLLTKAGTPFLANLPVEEIFTAPHRASARGVVRIARPITFGGSVIEGITLEFEGGAVVRGAAKTGAELLGQILATDDGAVQLGEVALVGELSGTTVKATAASSRLMHQVLLDENACSHIALGEAYDFCLRAGDPTVLNRSLIHIDLPIMATANLLR